MNAIGIVLKVKSLCYTIFEFCLFGNVAGIFLSLLNNMLFKSDIGWETIKLCMNMAVDGLILSAVLSLLVDFVALKFGFFELSD